jgi:hypothetical protein
MRDRPRVEAVEMGDPVDAGGGAELAVVEERLDGLVVDVEDAPAVLV